MTIRTSLSILAISSTLSFGWAALAQQNPATGTPPPSGNTGAAGSQSQSGNSQSGNSTGAAGSTSGGQQVISCLQRSAQGTQGTSAGSTKAGSGTQSGTAGSTGTATTGAGSTGGTSAGTSSTGAGSTGMGTSGAGSTGAAGGSTAGSTGAGSTAGSTGAGSTAGSTGATGTSTGGATGTAGTTTGTSGAAGSGTASTGSGSSGAGTTGSAGSGTTTTGTPATGGGTASTPGTTPANGGTGTGKSLSTLSSAEVCFLDKAAASNQFEIQSSQLALQKSTSSAVKKVAQKIITDHQTAGARLKTLAAGYGAVPSSQINTQQQQLIQTLRGQTGKNFDLVYLTQQVAAHNEAINLFTSYSQPASAADAAVRQFAAQTLPALKAHLQMVMSAQKSAGGTGSTTTTKPATGTPASSGSK